MSEEATSSSRSLAQEEQDGSSGVVLIHPKRRLVSAVVEVEVELEVEVMMLCKILHPSPRTIIRT